MPRFCVASRFIKYKRKHGSVIDVFNDRIHPKMVRKRNRNMDNLGYAKCFILGTFLKRRRIGHVSKKKKTKRRSPS